VQKTSVATLISWLTLIARQSVKKRYITLKKKRRWCQFRKNPSKSSFNQSCPIHRWQKG